jgi:hypothetical protein
MRTRKPYEVTVNLEYPTTERLDIPKEWVKNKCAKCGVPILIDKKNKVIHHKEPFCNWYHKAWLTPILMTQAIESYEFDNKNTGKLKRLLTNG